MAHGDITHIDIPADDVARAQQFYSGLFGWSISAPPGYEDYPMWRAPNGISGGGITSKSDVLSSPRSYVEVDSIDDTLARVTELGGKVLVPKSPISETSWLAVFEDTEGNQLGIYEGMTSM